MILPRTAIITLWFPKPSETFVFREVMELERLGLPVRIYSLYGRWKSDLSKEMAQASTEVERLGLGFALLALPEAFAWLARRPGQTAAVFNKIVCRGYTSAERAGENLWGFFCGLRLARRFVAEGISHIHAAWAGGPAAAAWTASSLTGIPFSFSARAGDIYPVDPVLADKIKAAAFVRTISQANVAHLRGLALGLEEKIRMIHDPLPLKPSQEALVTMQPPFKLLGLGRFVRKKGFDVLLEAAKIMTEQGLDFRLTLAGSGPWEGRLKKLARELGLESRVAFPGFVRHDQVGSLLAASDMLVMPCLVDPSGDRDGLPNVIVEALAHRLPVVATDVSGIGELIRSGQTGLLVPERNPAALAEAISRLTSDRTEALRLAERGRELVRKEFDLQTIASRLIQLFAASTASRALT